MMQTSATCQTNGCEQRAALCLTFIVLLVATFSLAGQPAGYAQDSSPAVLSPHHLYYEDVPVYDLRQYGYEPISLPQPPSEAATLLATQETTVSLNPNNPFASLYKSAPSFAAPGSIATYHIEVANYEWLTRTVTLTDVLPSQLQYVEGSAAGGLNYDPATRTFSWQGQLEPGKLEYVIEDFGTPLPYLDLNDFGAINLCDDFIANGGDCDDVIVTMNLGVNGYTYNLYGREMTEVVLSSNGIALTDDSPGNNSTSGDNQFLPDITPPGHLLAGLWRDSDMTAGGRWHAAIISGWIEGNDVFYVQWHNAPHRDDSDLTARHAIAIILNGNGGQAGNIYYLYDNVSDPDQQVALGYTIGLEDRLSSRGVTHSFSPCCGEPIPPRGYPPAPGTTLRVHPVLFGSDNNYQHTLSYQAVVAGVVPETIINTAEVVTDSTDPDLAYLWSTHYLYVRLQYYLPVMIWPPSP